MSGGGIKFELQKELFEFSKERLHGVAPVHKLTRRKKVPSYLCITGSIERPIRFTIYLVKKTEKGFKKRHEWTLSSLREANFKSKESLDFDLQIDKLYQWASTSAEEKEEFFSLLYQISSKLHRPPRFLNYQPPPEEEVSNGSIVTVSKDDGIDESEEEEFGISEREEFDLEKVLGRADNAIIMAETFMEQMAKELSILDGKNIHTIMESESQIKALMESIDGTIGAIAEIERELDDYEATVTNVKSSVEKIEQENTQMGTAAKNNQLLLSQLSNLVKNLDFVAGSALLNADLNTQEGIHKATVAANTLRDILSMEENIHPALLKMSAVEDQKRRLEKVKVKFSQNLTSQLAKLFIHYGNFSSLDWTSSINSLRLPSLIPMHNELRSYVALTNWLKCMDGDAFGSLLKTYTGSIGKIYEKNVKAIFEEARVRISGSISTPTPRQQPGSSSDLRFRGKYFGKTKSSATREGGGDNESQGSGEGSVDSSERQHFYDVLEQLLEGLEPAVNAEEKFVSSFFHIIHLETSSTSNTSPSKSSASGNELRRLMNLLFGSIEAELGSFLLNYEKIEASFCMGAMVRLGFHALKPENTSSYIGMIFGSVLVAEKRSFDRLMSSYVQVINDGRLPRRAKPGILPFITDFEDFSLMAESIFENSPRRGELDKWYARMLGGIFDGILRLSNESTKTPSEVIRMENFHRLHAILSKLKVTAMEPQKREAKVKYNEALNAYVTKYFGRPLVKLNEFFEGVQARVSQGVKESEIGYQMAFSRAELKRVIKEYPAKEVKKGLESLCRKVEKHLSEDESLLQVVWRAMQEEFIVQYKSIESLIGRCYPGSKITLEFTIEDILLFFSEIAQSH